jgi:hypothetical protein
MFFMGSLRFGGKVIWPIADLIVIRASKEFLVEKPLGRMVLHAICLCRGGRFRWHCAGIFRELRKMVDPRS